MRKALLLAVLAVGLLTGYAVRAVPASAQARSDDFQPFMSGAAVRLTVHDFPSGVSTISCTVSQVTEGFIACESEGSRIGGGRAARWVNLRFVQEIRPATDR